MTALGGLPVYLNLDGLRDWGGRKRQLMAIRHQLRRNTPLILCRVASFPLTRDSDRRLPLPKGPKITEGP
jgi:hypothetical protein